MVGEHSGQRLLVLQQGVELILWDLRKGCIGRCKHGVGSITLQGINQIGCFGRFDQRLEVSGTYGDIDEE